jgi:hypothetical protein
VSRGQRGGSPTVVNLSFLDRGSWALAPEIQMFEYSAVGKYWMLVAIKQCRIGTIDDTEASVGELWFRALSGRSVTN